MCSYVEVNQLAAVVANDQDTEEQTEGEGGDGEEAYGCDRHCLALQECPPCLKGFPLVFEPGTSQQSIQQLSDPRA